ncbi:hypothetical protein JX266_012499 [Neoarthrinium moseri]|nr:hypothetical protein JX266_012499 [Neoarthrinium moseri]
MGCRRSLSWLVARGPWLARSRFFWPLSSCVAGSGLGRASRIRTVGSTCGGVVWVVLSVEPVQPVGSKRRTTLAQHPFSSPLVHTACRRGNPHGARYLVDAPHPTLSARQTRQHPPAASAPSTPHWHRAPIEIKVGTG